MWENLYVIATQFAIEKQLKDLTHMLLFLNPMSQTISKGVFLLFSH